MIISLDLLMTAERVIKDSNARAFRPQWDEQSVLICSCDFEFLRKFARALSPLMSTQHCPDAARPFGFLIGPKLWAAGTWLAWNLRDTNYCVADYQTQASNLVVLRALAKKSTYPGKGKWEHLVLAEDPWLWNMSRVPINKLNDTSSSAEDCISKVISMRQLQWEAEQRASLDSEKALREISLNSSDDDNPLIRRMSRGVHVPCEEFLSGYDLGDLGGRAPEST